MLNTLTPIQCTPFWCFLAFTEGWCKFACCLAVLANSSVYDKINNFSLRILFFWDKILCQWIIRSQYFKVI